MSHFVKYTVSDIRSGLQTWRVLVAFSVPSFLISFATAIALA